MYIYIYINIYIYIYIYLDPPPPSPIHLHSAPFNFYPALCNNLNAIKTKIIARNWAFSPNVDRKIQNCQFWLKISTHGILEVLIQNPDFEISTSKFIFGQIWVKKVKAGHFDWKFSHRVSQACWLVFRHQFSEFPTLNLFLGKFGLKSQSCSFYLKIITSFDSKYKSQQTRTFNR